MLKNLSFFAFTSALAIGCVIVDDDSDTDTTASTSAATEPSTSTASTTETTTSETATGTSTATTGGPAACGWGPTGQDNPAEGYICEAMGEEDPDNAKDCPADIELVVGGACRSMDGMQEITGIGCCDSEGNVWICAQDPTGPTLDTIEC